jgi:4-hydroxybenzoate polyprenyltransferase
VNSPSPSPEINANPLAARDPLRAALPLAAARIVWETAAYRLRKREMANLAAAISVMVALRLGWSDVAVRTMVALGMNLLIYLNNDYNDIDADLASPKTDKDKTLFLHANRGAAVLVQVAVAAVLAAIGIAGGPGLLIAIAAGVLPVVLYSTKIKGTAYLDVLMAALCGTTLMLVAFPLDRLLGWSLALQLGLFTACFQVMHLIRDRDADSAFGIRTTAVRLGVAWSVRLNRALALLAAAFAVCFLHRWAGLPLLLAVLLPFQPGHADRYWNRVRVIFGLGWLVLAGYVFWQGHAFGWLSSASSRDLLACCSRLARW